MPSTVPDILGHVKMALDTFGLTPYMGAFVMVALVVVLVRFLFDR